MKWRERIATADPMRVTQVALLINTLTLLVLVITVWVQ